MTQWDWHHPQVHKYTKANMRFDDSHRKTRAFSILVIQEFSIGMYGEFSILEEVASHECLDPGIITLAIISVSSSFPLKYFLRLIFVSLIQEILHLVTTQARTI